MKSGDCWEQKKEPAKGKLWRVGVGWERKSDREKKKER